MRDMLLKSGFWIGAFFLLLSLYGLLGDDVTSSGQRISFSEFMDVLESDQVAKVVLHKSEAVGILRNGKKFNVNIILYDGLLNELNKHDVYVEVSFGDTVSSMLISLFISWLPFLVLIVIWIVVARKMGGSAGRVMGFGRSRAKPTLPENNNVTFDDVAGVDEAKSEVMELVEFLKDPQRFQKLGAKIPRGCLLMGPPGTGKTLLAKAIAGESGVPFFNISGSDFVEMFVGIGASRVRDMFDQGKKNAPCLIFIDEIDAVGRHRGLGLGGGNDEREQTLNQMLVEMDGFEPNDGVIVIGATNRPDVLDKALLRPGRFDRQVVVGHPDIKGREQILKVHMKNVKIAPNVSVPTVARGIPGFTGADIANLVNESALIAARNNKKIVTMSDFEYARDKIMMGLERKSLIMKDDERELTAYHEAGHAITSICSPSSDPIHKATIVPRGRALGLVMRLPDTDCVSLSRAKMKADIVVAMGGRAAEEIVFGTHKVTSGAESDITQVTELVRNMVMKWGMSDKVGLVRYVPNDDGSSTPISDNMSQMIDDEIRRYIDEGYIGAKKILNDNLDFLHNLAKKLLEHETLTGAQIKDLMDGKDISDDENYERSSEAPKSSVPGFEKESVDNKDDDGSNNGSDS